MVEITPGNRYRITAAERQSLSNDETSETSETIVAGNMTSTDRMSELLNEIMRMTRSIDNVIVLKRPAFSNHDKLLECMILQFMKDGQTYTRQDCKNYIQLHTDVTDVKLNEKVSTGETK